MKTTFCLSSHKGCNLQEPLRGRIPERHLWPCLWYRGCARYLEKTVWPISNRLVRDTISWPMTRVESDALLMKNYSSGPVFSPLHEPHHY